MLERTQHRQGRQSRSRRSASVTAHAISAITLSLQGSMQRAPGASAVPTHFGSCTDKRNTTDARQKARRGDQGVVLVETADLGTILVMALRAIAVLILLSVSPALGEPDAAEAPAAARPAGSADIRQSMCLMIEAAARSNDLPLEFFARVIWQESRFQPDVVGPLTRSGQRAQGIAQFMPGTAAARGLLDPFDPVQALPKAAEYLRDLRTQFGNLGLAAAAYNAGPQRLRDWQAGRRTLPAETRNYVFAVTGVAVDEWADSAVDREPERKSDCASLMALLPQAPNAFVGKLEERVTAVAGSAWGVQLSAGFSRDRALAAYAGIAQRYAQVLSGQEPILMSTTLRSRGTGTFYQVRIGAETRNAANALCESVRRAGGACI